MERAARIINASMHNLSNQSAAVVKHVRLFFFITKKVMFWAWEHFGKCSLCEDFVDDHCGERSTATQSNLQQWILTSDFNSKVRENFVVLFVQIHGQQKAIRLSRNKRI